LVRSEVRTDDVRTEQEIIQAAGARGVEVVRGTITRIGVVMRSRNIKPGFFMNELLPEIELLGRLLFIGLWLLADREGRLEDRPLQTIPDQRRPSPV